MDLTFRSLFFAGFGICLLAIIVFNANIDIMFLANASSSLSNHLDGIRLSFTIYSKLNSLIDDIQIIDSEVIAVIALPGLATLKLINFILLLFNAMVLTPLCMVVWILNVVYFIFTTLTGVSNVGTLIDIQGLVDLIG